LTVSRPTKTKLTAMGFALQARWLWFLVMVAMQYGAATELPIQTGPEARSFRLFLELQ
jgi:hypothetical protein